MLPYWKCSAKFSDLSDGNVVMACSAAACHAVYYAPSGTSAHLPDAGLQYANAGHGSGRTRGASGTSPADDH